MKENPSPIKGYILRNQDTEEYIAIDEASGGYPYVTTSLDVAKVWSNRKELEYYLDMIRNHYSTYRICAIVIEQEFEDDIGDLF
jgi:hypothetical protein